MERILDIQYNIICQNISKKFSSFKLTLIKEKINTYTSKIFIDQMLITLTRYFIKYKLKFAKTVTRRSDICNNCFIILFSTLVF